MILVGALAVTSFTACSDDNIEPSSRTSWPKDSLSVFSEAEWLPGGEKGTTSNEQGCYSNPVPQIEDNQQLYTTFKTGELFFEHDANTLVKPFWGLGPAYVRFWLRILSPLLWTWEKAGQVSRQHYGQRIFTCNLSPNSRHRWKWERLCCEQLHY